MISTLESSFQYWNHNSLQQCWFTVLMPSEIHIYTHFFTEGSLLRLKRLAHASCKAAEVRVHEKMLNIFILWLVVGFCFCSEGHILQLHFSVIFHYEGSFIFERKSLAKYTKVEKENPLKILTADISLGEIFNLHALYFRLMRSLFYLLHKRIMDASKSQTQSF